MRKLFIFLCLLFLIGCTEILYENTHASFIPRFSEKTTPKDFSFEGNTIVYNALGNKVKMKYVEDPDLDLFFLKYNLSNPFLNAPDVRQNYTFFILTFENNSETSIRFNPRRASIYVNERYYRGSLDYTEMLVAFRYSASDTDSSSIKKAMYDLELEIKPKNTTEGLLIFPTIPKGFRKIIVLLQDVSIGGAIASIPFEFQEK